MTAEETAELVETAEALTAWERTLDQFRATHVSETANEWLMARIRATRRAALGVQVQLLQPNVTRPHVLKAASAERDAPDPMDLYKRREEIARNADRAPGEIEEMRG